MAENKIIYLDQNILEQRADHYSQKEKRSDEEALYKEAFSFKIKNGIYLADVEYVDEILKVERISKVPNQRPFVLGVMNVRGEILLILDMGGFNSSEKIKLKKESRIVVLKYGSRRTGLLVDEVMGAVKLKQQDIRSPLETLQSQIDDYIEGFVQIDSKSAIKLNVEKLVLFISKNLNSLKEVV